VKCTLCECRGGGYSISINRSYGQKHRRGYAPGTVDFFALFIIPTDDWYIIPYEVIGEKDRNLHFRPEFWRQEHDKYKEAWHLLRTRRRARARRGLIFGLALRVRNMEAMAASGGVCRRKGHSRVRRMFRGLFGV